MLSHFPYEGDHFDEDRFDDVRATDSGLPILHGHTHSSNVISYSSKGTLQIHIGVDSWGFRPVSYERITEIIRALDTSV
jgi:calcineurin-like phosphoesterase family protein